MARETVDVLVFAAIAAFEKLRLQPLARTCAARQISERTFESRDVAEAPVDPHGLVALAWAVVRHTGSAPRRGRDFATSIPEPRRR